MNEIEEKAVEEMAELLNLNRCFDGDISDCRKMDSCDKCMATRLYEAGYRKQRTAQWVTIAETEDSVIVRYTHRCTDCNYFYKTVCPRGDDYCHKCGARMKGGERYGTIYLC